MKIHQHGSDWRRTVSWGPPTSQPFLQAFGCLCGIKWTGRYGNDVHTYKHMVWLLPLFTHNAAYGWEVKGQIHTQPFLARHHWFAASLAFVVVVVVVFTSCASGEGGSWWSSLWCLTAPFSLSDGCSNAARELWRQRNWPWFKNPLMA